MLIQQDPAIQRRMRLAEAMMRRDPTPVRHWTQGLSRLADAYLGGRAFKQAEDATQERQQKLMEAVQDSTSREELINTLAGVDPSLAVTAKLGQFKAGELPNEAREYEYFASLPPEQQRDYLARKRAGKVIDTGGGFSTVDPVTQDVTPIAEKTLKPEQEPDYLKEAAAAKAAGKNFAQAQIDLPKAQQSTEMMIGTIEKLEKHPGLDEITGFSSILNPVAIPGSNRADALAVKGQLQGQVFLEAYQQLRGGGQITEVEGQKAENAYGRLQTAQSKEEFLSALTDLKEVAKAGLERMKKRAGAPMPGAVEKDGNWYIQQNGQWFQVIDD